MATATNSCKYCNQIATGQITQLIVANFATRIFAVYNKKESSLKALAELQKTVFYNESEEVHWILEVIEHEVQCEEYEYQRQVPNMQHHSGKFIG